MFWGDEVIARSIDSMVTASYVRSQRLRPTHLSIVSYRLEVRALTCLIKEQSPTPTVNYLRNTDGGSIAGPPLGPFPNMNARLAVGNPEEASGH